MKWPALARRYLWNPQAVDQLLAQEDIGETTNTVKWPLADQVGSTRELVDSTGTVVSSFSYDAFGNPSATLGDLSDTRYLYTGQEYDQATGLHYYDARWYDAAVGSFLSEDPAAADVNPYRYCGNNPITNTDPSGMDDMPVSTIPSVSVSDPSVTGSATGDWGDAEILPYNPYIQAPSFDTGGFESPELSMVEALWQQMCALSAPKPPVEGPQFLGTDILPFRLPYVPPMQWSTIAGLGLAPESRFNALLEQIAAWTAPQPLPQVYGPQFLGAEILPFRPFVPPVQWANIAGLGTPDLDALAARVEQSFAQYAPKPPVAGPQFLGEGMPNAPGWGDGKPNVGMWWWDRWSEITNGKLDRDGILRGVSILTRNKLVQKPGGRDILYARQGEYRVGTLGPGQLAGTSGAQPCVGMILIPPPGSGKPVYVFHFQSNVDDPWATVSAAVGDNSLTGYSVVFCGGAIDEGDSLLSICIHMFINTDIKILGYVPASSVYVDDQGQVYYGDPATEEMDATNVSIYGGNWRYKTGAYPYTMTTLPPNK